jgi:hypothetical protein
LQALTTFSQDDSVKINELKVTKLLLTEKATRVKEQISITQALIDSCRKKILEIDKELDSLKKSELKNDQGQISQRDYQVARLKEKIIEIERNHAANQAILQSAITLINELDDEIKKLSKGKEDR